MPRPRCRRRVCFKPGITLFKPAGIPARELKTATLAFDELEAVRLKDFLGIGQEEAAERMSISQPTFHRLITEARKKIADALINGRAISIEEGNCELVEKGNFPRGRKRGFRKRAKHLRAGQNFETKPQ